MNWGRGLFRLWVIFSAIWITGLLAIYIAEAHLLEAKRTFEVEGPAKEKYEILAPPNATEAEVVAFAQQNPRTDCSANKSGPWCSYPAKLEMPRKPIDLLAIYLAVGVPVGTLLVGGGFYWALSGFRRTT
ncbi:hypothetical protein I6F21_14885 [Bradyrhizobium sp. NBAIM03]|uniref:hypothetical protein n=1 Tax=Bradyrhizobium sp. NBAIM03 TaxID=2793816 RepID=UPI001CD65CAA|nr:hypothetical protein [Bradyrhizobium sp. NBAIM03]MCA1533846.1 hypothetical protein [Bradyrhizobium sp. NBAIM03]